MKKTVFILLVVYAAVVFFVSCDDSGDKTYKVGGIGPGGGYIFYDCDADNDDSTNDGAGEDGLKSSVCGWRFLEAASSDLTGKYLWGPNADTAYQTETGIGTGQSNTSKLSGESFPAAYACTQYRGGGYSNWFLPSKDELNLMYENLAKKGLGSFSTGYGNNYLSSSEDAHGKAWNQQFEDGTQMNYARNVDYRVRPVRAFI